MQTWEIVTIALAALALLAALVWAYYGAERSRRLRSHFGEEYDRTVTQFGDRRRAESNLSRRKARVDRLDIRPLRVEDRERFQSSWQRCQSHFVDDPIGAVYEADELVLEIMRVRGYPIHDVEERFEDISASYPWLASDYRRAREIVARHRRGDASTEVIRQAMVHYRKIFSELLGEGRHEEYKRAS